MAFSGMSPGHPHGIGTFPQGGQGEFGAHATGAGDANHAYIAGVFHAAYASKVGGPIATPVAQEANDFGFPFGHFNSPYSSSVFALSVLILSGLVDSEDLGKNLVIVKAM
jgi:hypothetical protein